LKKIGKAVCRLDKKNMLPHISLRRRRMLTTISPKTRQNKLPHRKKKQESRKPHCLLIAFFFGTCG
jgi:hypothetical protein